MIKTSKFFAQKSVLKNKTNQFEMDLEIDIMTSGHCAFIVVLHATVADIENYYFLMGELADQTVITKSTKT